MNHERCTENVGWDTQPQRCNLPTLPDTDRCRLHVKPNRWTAFTDDELATLIGSNDQQSWQLFRGLAEQMEAELEARAAQRTEPA